MKFNGIKVPDGGGLVVEVHVDLMGPTPSFVSLLEGFGFENDPFSIFYPEGYTHHLTGRVRATKRGLAQVLNEIARSIEAILAAGADERFYVETELVRDVVHFSGRASEPVQLPTPLESFQFSPTGQFGRAKADVHVEFPCGQVTDEVRQYLAGKRFYWVETPQTQYFGPEEIATLQTQTYGSARGVYVALRDCPLPYCTAMHLEQKLQMVASRPGLPMPEVIAVRR